MYYYYEIIYNKFYLFIILYNLNIFINLNQLLLLKFNYSSLYYEYRK